jgi:hypothetical protein
MSATGYGDHYVGAGEVGSYRAQRLSREIPNLVLIQRSAEVPQGPRRPCTYLSRPVEFGVRELLYQHLLLCLHGYNHFFRSFDLSVPPAYCSPDRHHLVAPFASIRITAVFPTRSKKALQSLVHASSRPCLGRPRCPSCRQTIEGCEVLLPICLASSCSPISW